MYTQLNGTSSQADKKFLTYNPGGLNGLAGCLKQTSLCGDTKKLCTTHAKKATTLRLLV